MPGSTKCSVRIAVGFPATNGVWGSHHLRCVAASSDGERSVDRADSGGQSMMAHGTSYLMLSYRTDVEAPPHSRQFLAAQRSPIYFFTHRPGSSFRNAVHAAYVAHLPQDAFKDALAYPHHRCSAVSDPLVTKGLRPRPVATDSSPTLLAGSTPPSDVTTGVPSSLGSPALSDSPLPDISPIISARNRFRIWIRSP